MQGAVEELSFSELIIQEKPVLLSHDSSSEFSLEHWMEVCRLVEEELLAEIAEGESAGWR